jgi:hypothetical protein
VKKKTKKVVVVADPVPVAPVVVTVVGAGIVNGKFEVRLSNGTLLGGVEEVATKKVGYGNNVYVNIFCSVELPKENPPAEPSTPISQQMTTKVKSTIAKGKQP